MKLAEIQQLFWRAISWPTGIDDFLDKADDATRQAFAATFAETESFSRPDRLRVYAEAYFWRLFEVTADQFDITAWLAGPRRFHNFVTDYVLARPSRGPDVRQFAAGVPEALAAHDLARHRPGIEDIAAVQWAILQAVTAPDEPRLTAEALAQRPQAAWPTMRLQAVASAQLVPCRLDFTALHTAHAAEEAPPDLPLQEPTSYLVWRRPDLNVYHRALEPTHARALAALLRADTFEAICNATASPQTAANWLREWLTDGLVRALP